MDRYVVTVELDGKDETLDNGFKYDSSGLEYSDNHPD